MRREIVKELLQKLPESERTVMTLHYLGEMTIKTISEFLGVSPNTVKSRLSRARNRLKKEEDMIRQNLGSFQLPANLTETIMREVSRIVPTGPAANKPVLPWATVCSLCGFDFSTDGCWDTIPLAFPETVQSKRHIRNRALISSRHFLFMILL